MRMRPTSRTVAVAAIVSLVPLLAHAAPTWYGGLLHEPLGSASMALDPLGRLAVADLGPSGVDGVSIPVPNGARGLLTTVDLDPDGAPGVRRGYFIVMGDPGNLTVAPVMSVTLDRTEGGRLDVTAEASVSGATGLWVEVLDGDTHVFCKFIEELAVVVEPENPSSTVAHPGPRTHIAINVPGVKVVWESPELQHVELRWPDPVVVRFPSGLAVGGDGLRLSRIDGPTFSRLTAMRITGSVPPAEGTGSIAIDQPGVKVWDGVARALGDARFETSATAPFAAGNFGPGGLDGVAIDAGDFGAPDPESRSKRAEAELKLSSAAGQVAIECTGSLGGAAGTSLGTLTVSTFESDLLATPDFTSVGSSLWHARILRSEGGGPPVVVADLGGLDGAVRYPFQAWRYGWSAEDLAIRATIRHPDAEDFAMTIDGVTYVGDELEITPEPSGPPLPPVDHIERIKNMVTGAAQMDFFDIEVFPGPSPVTGVEDPRTVPADFATPRVWPNPARGGVTIEFATRREGPLRAVIHDAAGRRVRSLSGVAAAPGMQRLAWDGRDDSGRTAAAGLYFVRVEDAPSVRTGRFVRLR